MTLFTHFIKAALYIIAAISITLLAVIAPTPLRSSFLPIKKYITMTTAHKQGEVYFLSHGGPPTMFETQSKPYLAWQDYGKMVNAARPRGLVVVSAHWEDERGSDKVSVNVDSNNPLVYDFYNFPKHFYEQTFESRGDDTMLEAIKSALKAGGVEHKTEKRGLDHGVWVPFKVAFNGKTDFPVIQVSLPGDGSPESAARLGKALAPLRAQGYGIMGTGQAVHNLRDLFSGNPMPYTTPYLTAIQDALHSRQSMQGTLELFRHPLYKRAHPTPEHLLPLAVAVAAAGGSEVEDMFVGIDGGLSRDKDAGLGWGMWRWKSSDA